MPLMTLFNKSGTLLQEISGADEDELGNAVDDEREVDVICEVQQVQSEEPVAGGEASITTWLVFLPTETEVRTGDKLRDVQDGEGFDYGDFEFVGDPWDARQGRPHLWHVEIRAKQTRAPGREAGS